MEEEELPVFQLKVFPPAAVNVAFAPGHMDVFPLALAVIVLLTVTVAVALEEQVPAVTYAV